MPKQCFELTDVGYRCSRDAMYPTSYCWQHQGGSGPSKTAISSNMYAKKKPAAKKKAAAKRKA